MEAIDHIPVNLASGDVAGCPHIRPGRAASAHLDELVETARSLAALRAVPDISYVGARHDESVEVAGVLFRSRVLRHNLDRAQKLIDRLKDRWGFPGLSGTNAGSLEDRPISEQRPPFLLFGDTEKVIGVKSTERLLMLPRKSIAGRQTRDFSKN